MHWQMSAAVTCLILYLIHKRLDREPYLRPVGIDLSLSVQRIRDLLIVDLLIIIEGVLLIINVIKLLVCE